MKPVKKLETNYLPVGTIDMNDSKVAIGLNLAGLVLLFLFGWLFTTVAASLRANVTGSSPLDLIRQLTIPGFIVGLAGVLVLHEAIHSFFFWVFTGERPKFGFHWLYAYAAAPDWYLPRNQFIVVGMAPFLLITLAGLALLGFIPSTALATLLLALTVNAAGSVGDLTVSGWLLGQPATAFIHDSGPRISLYRQASSTISEMNQRWLKLIETFGVDDAAARQAFVDMVKLYNGPDRHYHNLEHIGTLLDTVESLQDLAQDPDTILLAVWFHDVIYLPGAKDNETRSAAYSRRVLQELGLPDQIVGRVSDLILATITHLAPPGDIDAQILLDGDLAPLAADDETFYRQSLALRQESAGVSDETFYAARVKIIEGFLERPRIYQTERLHDSLEARARHNLTQVIEAASSS